ncbi:MAG: hypothetical protein DRP76_03210, partial [Candidatus Omnitrophota bacterium]
EYIIEEIDNLISNVREYGFREEQKESLQNAIISLINPNLSYTGINEFLAIYKQLPGELQIKINNDEIYLKEFLSNPDDFLKSIAVGIASGDESKIHPYHREFFEGISLGEKEEIFKRIGSKIKSGRIGDLVREYREESKGLDEELKQIKFMELRKKLDYELMDFDNPYLRLAISSLAISEDKEIKEELRKISEKEEPSPGDKEFLALLNNFSSARLFGENILAGESIYRIGRTREDMDKEAFLDLIEDLLEHSPDEILDNLKKALEKIGIEIDVSDREKIEQEKAQILKQIYRGRVSLDSVFIYKIFSKIAILQRMRDEGLSKDDIKKEIRNRLEEAIKSELETYDSEQIKILVKNILYEKFITSFDVIMEAIEKLYSIVDENKVEFELAKILIDVRERYIRGKITKEEYDEIVEGILKQVPQEIIRTYLAYRTVLELLGQHRIDSGEFYLAWFRAEMIRRLAQGLLDIGEDLFKEWLYAEKDKELMKELFEGELGKEIFDRIKPSIIRVLKERYPDNKKLASALRKIEKAQNLKSLIDTAIALINEGTIKEEDKLKGVEFRFLLPEILEKQPLLTGGDFGMAEVTQKGDKIIVMLNIALLRDREGAPVQGWRTDLTKVILPHEITHIIIDAIAKNCGIKKLEIGNSANEEVVDEITPHEGLGELAVYSRIPLEKVKEGMEEYKKKLQEEKVFLKAFSQNPLIEALAELYCVYPPELAYTIVSNNGQIRIRGKNEEILLSFVDVIRAVKSLPNNGIKIYKLNGNYIITNGKPRQGYVEIKRNGQGITGNISGIILAEAKYYPACIEGVLRGEKELSIEEIKKEADNLFISSSSITQFPTHRPISTSPFVVELQKYQLNKGLLRLLQSISNPDDIENLPEQFKPIKIAINFLRNYLPPDVEIIVGGGPTMNLLVGLSFNNPDPNKNIKDVDIVLRSKQRDYWKLIQIRDSLIEKIMRDELPDAEYYGGQLRFKGVTIDLVRATLDSNNLFRHSRKGGEPNPVRISVYTLGISSEGKFIFTDKALKDLEEGKIRFIGIDEEEPSDYSRVDLVDVFRALRVKHQFGFEFTPETKEIIFNYPYEFELSKYDLSALQGIDLFEEPILYSPDAGYLDGLLATLYKVSQRPELVTKDLNDLGIARVLENYVNFADLEKQAKDLRTTTLPLYQRASSPFADNDIGSILNFFGLLDENIEATKGEQIQAQEAKKPWYFSVVDAFKATGSFILGI